MTIAAAQPRYDAPVALGEAEKFSTPFDSNAERVQPVDQQPLVLVLRKDMQERVGCQARADIFEFEMRHRLAFDPEIDRRHLVSTRDHGLGEIELLIELERARLNREGARGGAGLGGVVDDADLDAEFRKP